MSFDLAAIGRSVVSDAFVVDAEAAARYAASTGDVDPEHLSGRRIAPMFAVHKPVSSTMKRANDLVTTLFCLHGEHDIWFHRPLEAGMNLRATASPIGVRQNSAGVSIIIRCETHDDRGELMTTQYETTLARGASIAHVVGEAAPDHRTDHDALKSIAPQDIVYAMPPGQTRLYAAASGDTSSYTFDDEEARAKGLPGAIAHGLLTMGFCCRAMVDNYCDGDSRRLRRLAVRFSGLVRMVDGQSITTRAWRANPVEDSFSVGFDAHEAFGKNIIRYGLAIIALEN